MALELIYAQGRPNGVGDVDWSVEFEAGMCAGKTIIDGTVVWTVANGDDIPALGIIDDTRVSAFSDTVSYEEVIVRVVDADGDGKSDLEASGKLMGGENGIGVSNINIQTFRSDPAVILDSVHGLIEIPVGTELNYDADEDGTLDSVRTVCAYQYWVPNKPGEDSTLGSGKLTVWTMYGSELSTNIWDPTGGGYRLNDWLYCGPDGKLTRTQNGTPVAICTYPPTTLDSFLQFMWIGPTGRLPENPQSDTICPMPE